MNELKTPGLNNPETYVLTHNRFNTYIVLIFSVLKKAQIYKIPYRNSPHQEIDIVKSFDFLHGFGPDENNKDGNFVFEIGDKNMFMWGKVFLVLKQMMKLLIIFQNMVLTMSNIRMLTVKRTFTSCYIKNIFLFKNMKIRRRKTNISICIKRMMKYLMTLRELISYMEKVS